LSRRIISSIDTRPLAAAAATDRIVFSSAGRRGHA
jgi:hypothetical protein